MIEFAGIMGGFLVGSVVFYVATSIGKIVRSTEIIAGVASD